MNRSASNPLRKYLEENKMTREQFAHRVKKSTAFIIQLANGNNRDVKVSTLKAIHDETGISYDELIEWLSSSSPDQAA